MTNKPKNIAKVRRGKQRPAGRQAADAARGCAGNKPDPRASFKRYMELAREAVSSGDAVQSEYYQQYADHYHRLIAQG